MSLQEMSEPQTSDEVAPKPRWDDRKKEWFHSYYLQHKEHLNSKAAERLTCHVCHKTHTRGHQAKHRRTQYHQRALETLLRREGVKVDLKA